MGQEKHIPVKQIFIIFFDNTDKQIPHTQFVKRCSVAAHNHNRPMKLHSRDTETYM
jgi:hypothetical protein